MVVVMIKSALSEPDATKLQLNSLYELHVSENSSQQKQLCSL